LENCIQVWKSRKLSYKGKTITVKNLLLSYCGFEIEMKGIPDKFKKEIETLMWDLTIEHLQIKKVSLNLKSSLLNQYFPIAFQFSIGTLIMR
jgi:hypothetical protein